MTMTTCAAEPHATAPTSAPAPADAAVGVPATRSAHVRYIRLDLTALSSQPEIATLIKRADAARLPLVLSETGTPRGLPPEAERLVPRVLRQGLAQALGAAGVGGRIVVRLAWESTRLDLRIHTFSGRPALQAAGELPATDATLAGQIDDLRGRFEAVSTPAGYLTRAILPLALRSATPNAA